MIVSCHQPNYLPHLGLLQKAMDSDVLVLLDEVAFTRRDFTHRNKIRTPQGWMWLTVPVEHSPLGTRINDVKIHWKADNVKDRDWNVLHWKAIYLNYKGARFFNPSIEHFYKRQYERLCDLNEDLIMWLMRKLNVPTKVVLQSELDVDRDLKKSELIIELVRKVGGDAYLSGVGGQGYLDPSLFLARGLKLRFHRFEPPVYEQRYESFIPQMSAIDYLFNCATTLQRTVSES